MGISWKEYQKKIIGILAAGVGVYAAFRYLMPLVTPFLVAFCIVYLLTPWLNKVERRIHVRKEIILAGILVFGAAIVLAAFWAALQFGTVQAGELSENWDGICAQVGGQIRIFLGDCCIYVEDHFGVDAGRVEQIILERVDVFVEEMRVEFVPKLMKESWWYVKKLLSAIAFLGVGFIASLLLCRDYEVMVKRLQDGGEGEELLRNLFGILERIIRLVAVYLKAQALILAVIMLICCIGLWVGKVGHALTLGILAGILDALPFIGTGIVLMPTALWQMVNGRFIASAWCVVLYVGCVGVREFLEPKLMGKRTGIYPIFMLLSVYAGVKLFGLSGILKGPLALVVLTEIWESTKKAEDSKTAAGEMVEEG